VFNDGINISKRRASAKQLGGICSSQKPTEERKKSNEASAGKPWLEEGSNGLKRRREIY